MHKKDFEKYSLKLIICKIKMHNIMWSWIVKFMSNLSAIYLSYEIIQWASFIAPLDSHAML